jgi:hypothetical protein
MQLLTHGLQSFVKSRTSNRHIVFVLLLAVVMLCLVVSIAWAGNPGEGATTTGQPLRIQIVEPVLGQGFVPGTAITLTGQAVIGALNAPTNLAYVVDVSGSTADVSNQDCNGDSVINNNDNFNSDVTIGDTLDCEISGIIALNSSLSANNRVSSTVIVFGSSAAIANMGNSAGEQAFTLLRADLNTNGALDIEEVVRSLDQGSVQQFTPKNVSTGTNFNDALTAMNQAFALQPTVQKIAFFLSDGQASVRTDANSPLTVAANNGVIVNTYSIGSGATGCDIGDALRTIADTTGGVCTEVTDPSKLNTVLPGTRPTGIDHVEITVNNSAPISATLDTLGNWSAVITACATPNEPIVATVVATDGTRVAADIRLCPPTGLDEEKEPTDPNNTASRLFLPVVVKE